MKTILRILTLGIFMTALTAVSGISVFAQDVCAEVEAKQALYKKFTDNYGGTIDQRKSAIESGKQYVSKYGACADDKDIVSYLNTNIPTMEKTIADEEGKAKKGALYTRFDTSIEAVKTNGIKTADVFSSGKEILASEPEFLDVILVLASAGFDQAVANPPVDTYNNDTITYSKMAIEKIEANKPSRTGDYGVKQFAYKAKEYPDAKSNALGMMNYNIGYIMYYRQNKKKEALPFLYKSTQYNSFSKNNPDVYRTIGAWYLEEAIRMDGERDAKVKAAGNKDTEETLALLGVQKGYADRAIDAYARAYKLAKANTKAENKAYTDSLYTKLKELYAFRYNGKTDGIDAFVATVSSKPMPDPTSEVTPVKEEVPATTTNTTSSMTGDTTTAVQPTRPVATATTTKTTTTETNGNKATTTTKTKTVVKKPAPKKKGTR